MPKYRGVGIVEKAQNSTFYMILWYKRILSDVVILVC